MGGEAPRRHVAVIRNRFPRSAYDHDVMTRRLLPSFLSAAIATTLVVTGVPTQAWAAEPPAPAAAPSDSRAQAKARFDEGLTAYERSDFAGAIESWTSARALMADDPAARDAWHVLGLDLAQAHVRAYRLDRDAGHFAPAQELLDGYVAWVDRPAHTMSPDEEEDRPRAVEMLAFIEKERTARDDAAPSAPAPAPVVAAVPPSHADRAATPTDPSARAHELRTSTALIASGSVSLGLAVASGVALALCMRNAASAERDYEMLQSEIGDRPPTDEEADDLAFAEQRGINANAGTIASGVGIAVFTAAGVGMLASGLVMRKRALLAAPAVGKGYAGVALSMRF
jgi:hypothetical protein